MLFHTINEPLPPSQGDRYYSSNSAYSIYNHYPSYPFYFSYRIYRRVISSINFYR